MANRPSDMNDEQFVHAYLGEYLDDDVPADVKAAFEAALKKIDPDDKLAERFSQARGHFQVALQEYALDDRQLRGLHVLVQDDATRVAREVDDIATAEKSQIWGNVARAFVMALVAGVIIYVAVDHLKPEPRPEFNPLDTLVYEAMTMEDDPEGRLDLPTTDGSELKDYIETYPDLGFKAPAPARMPEGWELNGASVIDYDVAKIMVVQYGRQDKPAEKLFYFLYKGTMKQLPKSETGTVNGIEYYTYSNENINVIAWQVREGVMGMIVGHRSAPELAAFAAANERT